MNSRIISIENTGEYGLESLAIHGLNIYRLNDVEIEDSENPCVIFIKSFLKTYMCSFHTGIEGYVSFDEFDNSDAHEISIYFEKKIGCIETNIGFYDGFFYTPEISSGCFFPYAKPEFIDKYGKELLWYDSLALYIGDNQYQTDSGCKLVSNPLKYISIIEMYMENRKHINKATFTPIWLSALTDIYPLIIITDYDGSNFFAYSKKSSNLDIIEAPLLAAVEIIESSEWYRENINRLEWHDQCLMIKK